MRAPLSAVVITLNAARTLDACLESVAFAEERLVVDCGSTDATRDIALARGARFLHQDWLGYGRQKQFAAEQAAHDWVLSLDADEQVSPALRASIEAALAAEPPAATAWSVPRCNRFMGRWLRHGEGYPDWTVRLYRRDRARWSPDPVHERVVTQDPPARLSGDLLHDSAESLASYFAKQARYTSIQAEGLRGRGLLRNAVSMVLSPLARFLRFYLLRAGFLDGVPGLVHIAIGSFASGMKYRKALGRRDPGAAG